MFFVLLTYKKSMEEVEKALAEHSAFLDKYYEKKKLITSGRRVPRTGGFWLVDSADKTEVMSLVEEDPFYQKEIADYEVFEIQPTKHAAAFSPFIRS